MQAIWTKLEGEKAGQAGVSMQTGYPIKDVINLLWTLWGLTGSVSCLHTYARSPIKGEDSCTYTISWFWGRFQPNIWQRWQQNGDLTTMTLQPLLAVLKMCFGFQAHLNWQAEHVFGSQEDLTAAFRASKKASPASPAPPQECIPRGESTRCQAHGVFGHWTCWRGPARVQQSSVLSETA